MKHKLNLNNEGKDVFQTCDDDPCPPLHPYRHLTETIVSDSRYSCQEPDIKLVRCLIFIFTNHTKRHIPKDISTIYTGTRYRSQRLLELTDYLSHTYFIRKQCPKKRR